MPSPTETHTAPEPTPTVPADGGDPASSQSSTEPTPTAAPATPAPNGTRMPKVISMPTAALAKLKGEERRKQKKRMTAELDVQARAKGYTSHEDMMRRIPVAGATSSTPTPTADDDLDPIEPAAATPAAPAPRTGNGSGRTANRLERENQRLLEDRRRLNRARAHEVKRSSRLQRKLDANTAEHELRLTAVGCGVKDVDYAIHLVKRNVQSLNAKQLEEFDEANFFKDLRASHAYLFAVEQRPATTSPAPTSADGMAPAPGAPTAAAPEGDNTPVDANKLTDDEYKTLLRKRGLTPPQAGMIS